MRVALATVGTAGDVRPFANLAHALVERGHQVTAITWPLHRSTLAQPGVRVEVAGPHADEARIGAVAAEVARHGPLGQVAVLRDFHLADGEAHYRHLRELLVGHDLVLLHSVHALAHAAVLDLDLPYATAVFDPVLLPTRSSPPPGMPNLGPINATLWRLLDRSLARLERPLDELLQRAGSQQRGVPLFRARSPRLHLVGCSPLLMRLPPDLPPNTHVTGGWYEPGPPGPLPEPVEAFLADGPAPVVVTFGSMTGDAQEGMEAVLEGLLRGGRRVVVQGATTVTSPNLLATGTVDHRALFPRATLVVHHGGAGTTHAVCRAGVPSLVVPHVGDQRYWADRLHRLGVAPAPGKTGDLTSGALAERALAAASDAGLHSRARVMADALAQEDGVSRSVALLEGLAR